MTTIEDRDAVLADPDVRRRAQEIGALIGADKDCPDAKRLAGGHHCDPPMQPRLRFWLAEFFGKAKTATGNIWWRNEPCDDGTVWRTPLVPLHPETK